MLTRSFCRFVKIVQAKKNGLRLRCRIAWLRIQGVLIGKNVYIDKRVQFNLHEGSKLILRDGVAIFNDCRITVSPGGVLEIGEAVLINHHSELACSTHCVIGKNCAFGPHCMIIDSDHRHDDPSQPIQFQGGEYEPFRIDEDVWLGTKVIVLRGVHLGKHCVVGAGSVVTKDIEPFSLAVGVPAKTIRKIGDTRKNSREGSVRTGAVTNGS